MVDRAWPGARRARLRT